jgi:hypothetical protein
MTPSEERILYHLLWVWRQYGPKGVSTVPDGIALEHHCMGAGEHAGDLLIEYGLAWDQGWQMELTPAGIALLHREDIE